MCCGSQGEDSVDRTHFQSLDWILHLGIPQENIQNLGKQEGVVPVMYLDCVEYAR